MGMKRRKKREDGDDGDDRKMKRNFLARGAWTTRAGGAACAGRARMYQQLLEARRRPLIASTGTVVGSREHCRKLAGVGLQKLPAAHRSRRKAVAEALHALNTLTLPP